MRNRLRGRGQRIRTQVAGAAAPPTARLAPRPLPPRGSRAAAPPTARLAPRLRPPRGSRSEALGPVRPPSGTGPDYGGRGGGGERAGRPVGGGRGPGAMGNLFGRKKQSRVTEQDKAILVSGWPRARGARPGNVGGGRALFRLAAARPEGLPLPRGRARGVAALPPGPGRGGAAPRAGSGRPSAARPRVRWFRSRGPRAVPCEETVTPASGAGGKWRIVCGHAVSVHEPTLAGGGS